MDPAFKQGRSPPLEPSENSMERGADGTLRFYVFPPGVHTRADS